MLGYEYWPCSIVDLSVVALVFLALNSAVAQLHVVFNLAPVDSNLMRPYLIPNVKSSQSVLFSYEHHFFLTLGKLCGVLFGVNWRLY